MLDLKSYDLRYSEPSATLIEEELCRCGSPGPKSQFREPNVRIKDDNHRLCADLVGAYAEVMIDLREKPSRSVLLKGYASLVDLLLSQYLPSEWRGCSDQTELLEFLGDAVKVG